MNDGTINVISENIKEKTGVWYYTGKLLKKHGLENSGRNQYQLLVWLEKENGDKIKNHIIQENVIIKIPAKKEDLYNICLFKIKMNEYIEAKIESNYCIHFPNMAIFESKKQPGYDEFKEKMVDMESNDESDEEILNYGKEFLSTINNYNKTLSIDIYMLNPFGFKYYKVGELVHIGEMRTLLQQCSFLSQNMKKENEALLEHFIEGSGTDYYSDLLSEEACRNKSTKTFINFSKKTVQKYIKEYSGNVFEIKKNGKVSEEIQGKVHLPKFENPFDGLMIAIHVTHGSNIYINDVKIENSVFKCELMIDIFDHYGLNSDDLTNSRFGIKFIDFAGFRAWYYLQHSKKYAGKYKPFVTHIIYKENLEVHL